MRRVVDGHICYGTSTACKIAGIKQVTHFRLIRAGLLQKVTLKDRDGWRLFSMSDIEKVRSQTDGICPKLDSSTKEPLINPLYPPVLGGFYTWGTPQTPEVTTYSEVP
jgi:hypothetical protein